MTATLRPALAATILGQLVGVVGLLIQWLAAPEKFADFGFPPGISYVLGATLIVWVDRRSTWSPTAAIGLALWIVAGGLAGGDLQENLASDNTGLVVGNVVMVVGLLCSAGAGVAAIGDNRRRFIEGQLKPVSRANPRRVAVLVTVAALLAVAIGDGAPEGLDWDGPGPALFLILAIVVALVPGRSMILLSIIMCIAFLAGAVSSPDSLARFAPSATPLVLGSAILQTVGLVVALLAGIVAILPSRIRSRTH